MKWVTSTRTVSEFMDNMIEKGMKRKINLLGPVLHNISYYNTWHYLAQQRKRSEASFKVSKAGCRRTVCTVMLM